ncbi:MAG: type II secretion system protein [Woeseiaceae bacterium]
MRSQNGFTLVELSIVILIMGLILGGLAMPLSTQLENGRIRETKELLSSTEAAIEGYALVNGFLPCPATPGSNGLSATLGGACVVQHGFVPASTLGLAGPRNDDNLMLDSWASPIRYSVTASDVDGDGNWDFIAPGEMRNVTMALLTPDLAVCSTGTGSSANSCSGPATTLTNSAPSVVYSMGKDWGSFTSADQLENVGATIGGGPTGTNYRVAADLVSVSRRRSERPGNEFDDLVSWTAASSLYRRMVAGGQLP